MQNTDPFGISKNRSAEAKERGLVSELNNGRLAQIGILGFLAEQKVEGSVPLLTGLVSHYNGEPMAPVSVSILSIRTRSIPYCMHREYNIITFCLGTSTLLTNFSCAFTVRIKLWNNSHVVTPYTYIIIMNDVLGKRLIFFRGLVCCSLVLKWCPYVK